MVMLDIEIPTYCYDCPCHNGENGQCNVTGKYTSDKRPFDCPLKEEKHAHWIPKQYPFGNCECSNCQEEYGICGGLLGDYNYCPNCGAKMDGKEEV